MLLGVDGGDSTGVNLGPIALVPILLMPIVLGRIVLGRIAASEPRPAALAWPPKASVPAQTSAQAPGQCSCP